MFSFILFLLYKTITVNFSESKSILNRYRGKWMTIRLRTVSMLSIRISLEALNIFYALMEKGKTNFWREIYARWYEKGVVVFF